MLLRVQLFLLELFIHQEQFGVDLEHSTLRHGKLLSRLLQFGLHRRAHLGFCLETLLKLTHGRLFPRAVRTEPLDFRREIPPARLRDREFFAQLDERRLRRFASQGDVGVPLLPQRVDLAVERDDLFLELGDLRVRHHGRFRRHGRGEFVLFRRRGGVLLGVV